MKLKEEIGRWSKLNGYEITKFNEINCECSNNKFLLFSNDAQGAAFVVCTSCGESHDIEQSSEYMTSKEQNVCNCDNPVFEIGVGKAFYKNTNEVRWVYVGGKCTNCNLCGVYVDWNER